MKFILLSILSVFSSTALSEPILELCQVRAQVAAFDHFLLVWPWPEAHNWGVGIVDTVIVSNSRTAVTFEVSVEGSFTESGMTTSVYHRYSVSTIKQSNGNCTSQHPVLLSSNTK